MTRAKPVVVLVAALALGLLFDYFVYGKLAGAGLVVWFTLGAVGIVLVARQSGKVISRAAWWLLALSFGFAAMLMARTSYELTFMNIVLVVFLWLLVAKEFLGERIREFVIERYASLGWLPMYFLGNIGVFFRDWYQQRLGTSTGTGSRVLRGVLLALPVVIVFALLFASADLVFRKYARELVDIDISFETLLRIMIVVFLSLGFVGTFWYVFGAQRKPSSSTASEFKPSKLGRVETGILLGSVNVLFLLFVLVQLTYLFGGQQNITEQGFTYAEYARRGFFELMIAAVVSWLLVWTLNRSLEQSELSIRKLGKQLSFLLVAQVFIIMASAFVRLVLYEQAYGFTTLRFYSHVFIIWLAVVFVLLLIRLLSNFREETLAFSLLVSIVVFAAGVNLFSPDAFIARQNIARYQHSGKIDALYLNLLSDDAVPVISQLLNAQDETVKKTIAHDLYEHRQWLESSRTRDWWQSKNLSRRRARTILNRQQQILEENKDFSTTPSETNQSLAP